MLGDPFAERTTLGPLNNAGVAEKMDEHVADALERGATRRERRRARRRLPDRPLLAGDDPRRRARPTRSSRSEETFGPVAPVVEIDSLEQAIELTNASPYGLLSAIFTRDLGAGPALRRRGAHRLGERQRVVELLGEPPAVRRPRRHARAASAASAARRRWSRSPSCRRSSSERELRLRDRRRRLRRLRARQPAERRLRRRACSCSRRAGPTTPWDLFIHMPAALSFPIGNPRYDWMYESEPEPFMRRPARLPRARQGARRVELDQRDDLPARQPARLRALGRRARAWRAGTTRTACRTSSGWRPASPAPTRTAAATGRSCSSAAPAAGPLFEAAFFEAVQQAGYRLTDDVNGYRQEGFAALRPHDPPRPAAERRAGVPAPGARPPNLEVRCRAFVTRVLFERDARRRRRGGRGRATVRGPRGRGDPLRRRDQLAAAAAALGRRQRGRARGARRGRRARPARRRREPPGPPRGLRPARLHASRSRCSPR